MSFIIFIYLVLYDTADLFLLENILTRAAKQHSLTATNTHELYTHEAARHLHRYPAS